MVNSLEGYTAVGWNDQLVIFGGKSDGIPRNGTWVLKTTGNENEAVAREVITAGTVPEGKVFHTATVVDNKMYVIGGLPKNLATLPDVNKVDILDIPTMTWSSRKATGAPPGPRCHHASCAIGTTIYTYGGYSLSDKPTDTSVFAYETTTNSWTCLKTSSLTPLWGHTMEVHGSKLVIFGGVDKDRERNVMYFYDTKTGESRTLFCELLSDRVGVVKATHDWTPAESDKNKFMALKEGDIISVMRDGNKPVPGWKRGFKLPNIKGWFPATRVEDLPATRLLALHEIPPSASLTATDIGSRLQIKETGQVLIVKEDYSGYAKVPPDTYTEGEIAYQPTKFHPVPFPRALHSSCALNGGIFIWSGEHSKSMLQDGWRIEFSTGTWKYLGSAKSEDLPQSGTPCVHVPEFGKLRAPVILVPILSQNKMLKFDITLGEWGSVPLRVIAQPVTEVATEVLTPPRVKREDVELATPVREAVPVPVVSPVNQYVSQSDPPILQGQARMISPRPPSPGRVDWMSPARIRPPITKTSGFNIPFSPYERTPEGYLVIPQEQQSPQISNQNIPIPSPQIESPRDWIPSNRMSSSPPHVQQIRRTDPVRVQSRERSTSVTSLIKRADPSDKGYSTQLTQTPKKERSTSVTSLTTKRERSTSMSSLVSTQQQQEKERQRRSEDAAKSELQKREAAWELEKQQLLKQQSEEKHRQEEELLKAKSEKWESEKRHLLQQQEDERHHQEDQILKIKTEQWEAEKQSILQHQAEDRHHLEEELLKLKSDNWEAEKERLLKEAAQEKADLQAKLAEADAIKTKENQWKQELAAIQQEREEQRKKYAAEMEKIKSQSEMKDKEQQWAREKEAILKESESRTREMQKRQLAEHEKQWDLEREQLLKERLDMEDKLREQSSDRPREWGEWQSSIGGHEQHPPTRYDDELLIRKEPGTKVGLTWKGDMLLDVTGTAAAEQGAERFIGRRLTHIGAVPINAISSVMIATRDMANVRYRFAPRVEGINDQVRNLVREELNRRTPRRSTSRSRGAVSSPRIRSSPRQTTYSPVRGTPSPRRGDLYRNNNSPATRQTCSSIRKRNSFNSVDPPYIHPHTTSANGTPSTPSRRTTARTPGRRSVSVTRSNAVELS
eukprot:TRINITY_DN3932_c0_g1_i1.p1 TRINITY_DN3932_c0_g1~~TRINITY_DN3932_c0_g1_i1.p1  ORF type:complete len:1127 (+),score=219.66 TRINITY_DN3932_c0_g1_i1:69-3449(+)